VVDGDGAPRLPTPEQLRRRRRRSIALALLLAALAVLFYVMAIMHGPGIMDRPL
jgi:hypothetical protein